MSYSSPDHESSIFLWPWFFVWLTQRVHDRIYLFVQESAILIVSVVSSNFFQVIVSRVSSPHTSQHTQTRLVLYVQLVQELLRS